MTLSDWTEQNASADQNQSSTEAHGGTYSWKFGTADKDHVITFDQSGTDTPKEARIRTYMYMKADFPGYAYTGFVLRWQDMSNYYIPYYTAYNDTFQVTKIVGGSSTNVGSLGVNVTTDAWRLWDIESYVDSAGTWNLKVQADTDGDDTAEDIGTIQDSSPDLTSGGAVGLGSYREASGTTDWDAVFYDDTEIHY